MFNVTTPSEVYDKAKSLHMKGMRSWDDIYEMMKEDKDLLAELERERCSLGDYMDYLMSWVNAFSNTIDALTR